MGLNFSQKRLVSAPLRGKAADRLQLMAFLTGVMSTLISLASVILVAFGGK